MLPHRYPFLLVDRVIEIEGYQRAVGIKNVTINEPFFAGHYPDTPIMPGVLHARGDGPARGRPAAAQARAHRQAGRLPRRSTTSSCGAPVMPGDQLRLEVETVHLGKRGRQGARRGPACAASLVAEAEMKFMLVDSPSNVEDQEL